MTETKNETQQNETPSSTTTKLTDDDWKKLIPENFSATVDVPAVTDAQPDAEKPIVPPGLAAAADLDNLLWGGDAFDGPTVEYGQEYVVTRDGPLQPGEPQATTEDIIKAISSVDDPELMLNVYDLGLIYRMDKLTNGDVEVDMTVTAAGCPVAGLMLTQVADALAATKGIGKVTVKLVWEPAWTIDRMSENARYQLDMF